MARKYLENAGVDIGVSIDPIGKSRDDDNRVPKWKSEIEQYGFSSTDLWNLDRTMLYLLYERLSMWIDKNSQYEDPTRVTINGVDAELAYWISEILKLSESVFSNDSNPDVDFDNEKSIKNIKKVWTIWSEISPVMWL